MGDCRPAARLQRIFFTRAGGRNGLHARRRNPPTFSSALLPDIVLLDPTCAFLPNGMNGALSLSVMVVPEALRLMARHGRPCTPRRGAFSLRRAPVSSPRPARIPLRRLSCREEAAVPAAGPRLRPFGRSRRGYGRFGGSSRRMRSGPFADGTKERACRDQPDN